MSHIIRQNTFPGRRSKERNRLSRKLTRTSRTRGVVSARPARCMIFQTLHRRLPYHGTSSSSLVTMISGRCSLNMRALSLNEDVFNIAYLPQTFLAAILCTLSRLPLKVLYSQRPSFCPLLPRLITLGFLTLDWTLRHSREKVSRRSLHRTALSDRSYHQIMRGTPFLARILLSRRLGASRTSFRILHTMISHHLYLSTTGPARHYQSRLPF